jgi:hypothetical protein
MGVLLVPMNPSHVWGLDLFGSKGLLRTLEARHSCHRKTPGHFFMQCFSDSFQIMSHTNNSYIRERKAFSSSFQDERIQAGRVFFGSFITRSPFGYFATRHPPVVQVLFG